MSYTVHPYLVDLQKLRKVYGSKDTNLATAIEAQCAEYIARHDRRHASAPPLVDALRQVINGEARQEEFAWQYGYALELLCIYLGVRLPNDHFEGLRGAAINMIGEIDGLRELNHGSKLPIPVAAPSDFPAITFISDQDAVDKLTRYRPRAASAEESDADQQWLKDVQDQYQTWLQESARSQRAIIAFLY